MDEEKQKPGVDEHSPSIHSRIQRESAKRAKQHTKDLVAGGLLNIKTQIKAETKVPTHAWKWEEFLDLCEMDQDSYQDTNHRTMTDKTQQHRCGTRSEDISLGSDDSHDAFDEFWDNSKEQYETLRLL